MYIELFVVSLIILAIGVFSKESKYEVIHRRWMESGMKGPQPHLYDNGTEHGSVGYRMTDEEGNVYIQPA